MSEITHHCEKWHSFSHIGNEIFIKGGNNIMREKSKIPKVLLIALIGVVLLFSLILPTNATATPADSYVYLGKITLTGPSNVFPGRLAIDNTNTLYVVDGNNNRLIKTNANGDNLGTVSVDNISAVAISSNGVIYVGVGGTSPSILKYSTNGTYIGVFTNNIASVFDIAVDNQTGDVYVVDNISDNVSVFASDGTLKMAITGIHLPKAVFVTDSEIYVLDSPVVVDPTSGANTTGARISVFDKTGNLLRSFSDFLADGGHMKSPQDIVVDSAGYIMIPEAITESILVYDNLGNYVGEIISNNEPMHIPGSIVLGADGRLYVSSTMTSSVLIFGLSGYTVMDVTPSSLSFKTQSNSSPATKTITITNSGVGVLDFQVILNDSWVSVDNNVGTIQGNGSFDINVTVNPSGLTVGTYSSKIDIISSTGITKSVNVILEVLPAPEISVTPQSLTFDAIAGGSNPLAQTVTIQINNDPNGTVIWSATTSASWLSISPSSGNGATITQANVNVDITGLSAGTYTGNINIVANDAINSPVTVSVTLNIQAAGTIQVTTNLDAAQFTITGPVTYQGSGANWSISNVPAGTYTITYKDVPGYITPASETLMVNNGEVIIFNGIYQRITKSIIANLMDKRHNNKVLILDDQGNAVKQLTIDVVGKGELISKVGDIDGDGIDEIVVIKESRASEVGVYNIDGVKILNYVFDSIIEDNDLALYDIDNDGAKEIIVGSKIRSGEVNVLDYDNGAINSLSINSGIFLKTLKRISIAVGDVDSDGVNEILVAAKLKDKSKTKLMKFFEISVDGILTEDQIAESMLNYDFKCIEIYDLDSDGLDDIVIVGKDGLYSVDMNGNLIVQLIVEKDIISVDFDDINSSYEKAEIVVGKKDGIVSIYSNSGSLIDSYKVFDSRKGVNVNTGYLGL